MKKIGLFFALLVMAGCSTAGNLYTKDYANFKYVDVSSVEVRLNPNLSYWWGPWEPDLKDRVAAQLKDSFRKSGFAVVSNNADIVVLINKIETGGWTGGIVITEIDVVGLQNDNEIFKVSYSQHGESFTVGSIMRPSKNEIQVSKLLAKKIIKKLKNQ